MEANEQDTVPGADHLALLAARRSIGFEKCCHSGQNGG